MANTLTEERRAQDWINLVLGAVLFLSPWLVGFSGEKAPAWNAWIVGALIAAMAIAALSAFAEWEEWASVVLGVWLVVAPWALGFAGSANPLWTHVILGVLTAGVAGWALWDYRHGTHVHA